jgi:hypothetical protein
MLTLPAHSGIITFSGVTADRIDHASGDSDEYLAVCTVLSCVATLGIRGFVSGI